MPGMRVVREDGTVWEVDRMISSSILAANRVPVPTTLYELRSAATGETAWVHQWSSSSSLCARLLGKPEQLTPVS